MTSNNIIKWLPLIVLCLIWEFFATLSPKIQFLFAAPSLILSRLIEKLNSGELINHTMITAFEALSGLLLGILIGSVVGFSLLYFKTVSKISKPYILGLSSIPIFGIAPMMIIWFGIGIEMKIAMAFFSTVFVAISQAYQGGQNMLREESLFFDLNSASEKNRFMKLVLPSSIEWVIQSLKLNSGLAILGAFIGEFVASEAGLGYIILRASGLYDVPYVLSAIICIIMLSICFNYLISLIEKRKLKIIRFFALDNRKYSDFPN